MTEKPTRVANASPTPHEPDHSLHVVLGASGGTGAAVVRALVAAGHHVRAVGRRASRPLSAAVEVVATDVTDASALRRALAGAGVVYHCAQPSYRRWAEEFPPMNAAVAEATAAVGAKLVFADNLYMYGPVTGPLTEASPQQPSSEKGRVRKAMAETLLDQHRAGRLRVVIARSSDYYGPGGLNSAFGERQLKALMAGRKVQWFGDLDQPHTMSFLDDMARAMVVLGERSEADGAVWHLPADEALTGRRFVELAARVAGTAARPVALSMRSVRVFSLFVPILREFPELAYQWTQPFVSDASRFEQAFGPFSVTPHETALAAMIEWYRNAIA